MIKPDLPQEKNEMVFYFDLDHNPVDKEKAEIIETFYFDDGEIIDHTVERINES
jgi:hypothetical protein